MTRPWPKLAAAALAAALAAGGCKRGEQAAADWVDRRATESPGK